MRTAALLQVFTQLLCLACACVSASHCPTIGVWIDSSFHKTEGTKAS